MSSVLDFFNRFFSRQGKEATTNKTSDADNRTKTRQIKRPKNANVYFLTLRTETIHLVPTTQRTIIRSDVCYNCKNNTNCEAYQRMLEIAETFTCENRQSTAIQQEQTIQRNLYEVGSSLVKQQRRFVAKRLASCNFRCLRKKCIYRIIVHNKPHKTKQDRLVNITKDFIRQTNIERFL